MWGLTNIALIIVVEVVFVGAEHVTLISIAIIMSDLEMLILK